MLHIEEQQRQWSVLHEERVVAASLRDERGEVGEAGHVCRVLGLPAHLFDSVSDDISVLQQQVIVDSAYDAIYKLTNPNQQIDAYVANVLRGEVPKMKLDDVFTQKEELAKARLKARFTRKKAAVPSRVFLPKILI